MQVEESGNEPAEPTAEEIRDAIDNAIASMAEATAFCESKMLELQEKLDDFSYDQYDRFELARMRRDAEAVDRIIAFISVHRGADGASGDSWNGDSGEQTLAIEACYGAIQRYAASLNFGLNVRKDDE